MNINSLHDDCMLLLFKQFSLQELIQLRPICVRWNSVIERITQSKRSLKLFVSFESVYRYSNDLISFCREDDQHLVFKEAAQDDSLVITIDNLDIFDILTELFPDIHHLVVHLNKNAFILFPVLLEKWPNLASLSIFGDIPGDEDFLGQLCGTINSLKSLRRLEFFNKLIFSEKDVFNLDTFPLAQVLSQLEVFSLIGYAGDVVEIARQLGPNLKQLTIDRISFYQLQKIFKINPHFGNNLIGLSLDDLDDGSLYFICQHFPGLKCLEIGIDDVKINEIANHISHLKQLTEVRFRTLEVNQLERSQQEQELPLIQLKSIRKVNLFKLSSFLLSRNGPNLLCSAFAAIFPNAEQICIRNEQSQNKVRSVLVHRIIPENLSPDELRYLSRYHIYSIAEMTHVGRFGKRCMDEKRNRKLQMWEAHHYEFQ